MTLTNLHTETIDSYQADRDLSIKISENDPLRRGDNLTDLKPYFDEKAKNGGSIAIGYGFDLLVHSDAEIDTSGTDHYYYLNDQVVEIEAQRHQRHLCISQRVMLAQYLGCIRAACARADRLVGQAKKCSGRKSG
jgi:hypothetical protein